MRRRGRGGQTGGANIQNAPPAFLSGGKAELDNEEKPANMQDISANDKNKPLVVSQNEDRSHSRAHELDPNVRYTGELEGGRNTGTAELP